MPPEPIICGLCGFKNSPNVRFCGGCGEPVTEMQIEEERKAVAILFADICNFTELVASHDPEETKDKIEECLRVMANQVVAMNGVVEKFIGDSIMAVFGVPATHENDAELAVRAGIRIVDSARSYGINEGLELEVRVGVHFGEVIVSHHSRAPGRAHHVFGNAVNVASRLESTGIVATVVTSEEIYKRTKGFFTFDELSSIKLKGVREKLKRYRVTGEKVVRGKIRGIPGLSSPLIGRKDELELLRKTYSDVSAGKGLRAVTIVGEAGIGKTRLVEELLYSLQQTEMRPRVLHGRCLGYAGAPTYFPFSEIIKKALGVKDDMPQEEIIVHLASSVEGILGVSKIGDIDVAGILGEILALSSSGDSPDGRDTKQIHNQVLLVVEKLIGALAAESPIVLLIEDVQWADNSSLTLIGHLTRSLGDARCLLILNSRPPEDNGATWSLLEELKRLPNHLRIDLKDLTPEDTRRLVSELLTIEKLSEQRRQVIVELAAGNPFFVEEIIKVLIEKGYLEHRDGNWVTMEDDESFDVPDTVEGVLRSRIDNLPSQEKKVIQRASVVGEVFWRQIVSELMNHAIGDYLIDLEKRDLIHQRLESIFEDDLEYTFKHVLLHETVYKSLLRRERQELHLKTAEWVERNYSDRIQAYESMIAHHFEMGGAPKRAAEYYFRAGKRAASLYANEDAKGFFAKTVENTRDDDLIRRAYLCWGNVCHETGKTHESIDRYTAALGYCRRDVERAEVMERMGLAHQRLSEYPRSLDYYDDALTLIKDEPPSVLHGKILEGIAWVCYLRGENEDALSWITQAEETFAKVREEDFVSDTVRARISSVHASILSEMKRPEEAQFYSQRTLALYEKQGYLVGMQSVLNNMATVEMYEGRYGAALELLIRSYDLASRCGYRLGLAINCYNIGDCYITLGDFTRAEEYLTRYLEINEIIANRLGDGYAYYGFASLARKRGETDKTEDYYHKAIQVYDEVGSSRVVLDVKLSLATFYAEMGREEEAEKLFAEVEEVMKEKDIAIYRLEAFGLASRRRKFTGQEKERIRKFLPSAETVFEEETDLMGRTEAAVHLSTLYEQLDEPDRAEHYREQARRLLHELAENVGNEKLKKSFLELMRKRGFVI